LGRRVECPALAFWGAKGLMHKLFDIEAQWRRRCANLKTASLPGGHFFIDQFPDETARILADFLGAQA
jgi:haloacetate dehalogenase